MLLFVAVVVAGFVAVVVVVILYCFYLPIYYTGCIQKASKSDIGYIRSKRDTVQP